MNYFIIVVSGMLDVLRQAGIGFCQMELSGRNGIVVSDEDLEYAMYLLDIRRVEVRATGYEGIEEIIFEQIPEAERVTRDKPTPVKDGHVQIASWDGKNREAFAQIVNEILIPVVGDVVIHVPHGKNNSPILDGKFHIFVWSSHRGSQLENMKNTLWGIRVDCINPKMVVNGEDGIAICEDPGYIVADLRDMNLYILFDAVHYGSHNELTIFRKILEEVVGEITMNPEEKTERERVRHAVRLERFRSQYIQECSGRIEKNLTETRKTISEGKSRLANLQKELVTMIRKIDGAERKLENLTSRRHDELEKFGLEFDRMASFHAVEEVTVEGHKIKVFTDTLYCVDPRTDLKHEIGRFRIEIMTDGSRECVSWFNLTRQVDGHQTGMQAPHVFPKGNACLGSASEIFPDLIGRYEFAAVVQVAIQFIESVNVDDSAGKYINRWPVANK